MSALQITWFWLIFLLLTVYAVLDGFDLGSGFWYLFAKWDRDKRTILNSIGPFWDGNEVWLLTGAGSIFAAFPHVYATVFSGFYLPFMLIIFSFILRAVSIEFRNKIESSAWQNFWGLCFSVGSIVPTFLFGVAAGNIMRGLPLNEYMGYTGNFIFLLNPFALLIGFLSLAAFATHAATYLVIRIKGEIISMARSWVVKSWRFYIVLFIITFMVIYYTQPRLFQNYFDSPILWIVPAATFSSIMKIWAFQRKGWEIKSFIASVFSIIGLMIMFALAIFPNTVPAINDAGLSLTIANSSSSELTLKTMLIIALIGMPFVVGYTAWIYYKFSGRVGAEDEY